jgi:Protein kinase domain
VTDSATGPGTVLAGRFALEDLLDESAGALFWRATDQVLARSVAVHVLPDTDPRAGALLDAARSSALVSDPHLLRVLDAAAADGVVYVVNEWGSGVSLDRLLADGALSPRRAAWVVLEVAQAISTAHRNGVAHGRLLPENVMISETGTVKLIGFVVDAVLRYADGQRLVTDGTSVSPHQSDVLNLAALLYAALVGRWPGTTGSTIPVAPTEHGRPLRPRRVRAGVPRPLDAICEQVLNAGAHPGAAPIDSALEIQAALSDFLGDPGGSSTWGPSGFERTAVLGRSDLPAERDDGSPAGDREPTVASGTGEPTVASDTGEPTVASDVGADAGVDPEATQAGAPLFLDDAGPATRAPGSGPGPAPMPTQRPLFADDTPGQPPPRRPSTDRTDASPRTDPLSRTGAPGRGSSAGRTRGAGSSGATSPQARIPHAPWAGPGPAPAEAAVGSTATHATSEDGSVSGGPRAGSIAGRSSTVGPSSGGQRSVGAGNGSVPPVWGPDADTPPEDDGADPGLERRDEDLPGRSWLRLGIALAAVLVLVVAVVFAYNLSRGPADEPTTSTGARRPSASQRPAGATRVSIAGVKDFDPEADPPEENPELAHFAIDGKPDTFWTTVTYRGKPELGGLKSGVGLLVDLGRKTGVGEVRLTLGGSPTAVQILAAPDASSAPTTNQGLPVVAANPRAGTKVDLRLKKAVTTRWLVVWLTSLPSAPGGYQGRVAEISVRS